MWWKVDVAEKEIARCLITEKIYYSQNIVSSNQPWLYMFPAYISMQPSGSRYCLPLCSFHIPTRVNPKCQISGSQHIDQTHCYECRNASHWHKNYNWNTQNKYLNMPIKSALWIWVLKDAQACLIKYFLEAQQSILYPMHCLLCKL